MSSRRRTLLAAGLDAGLLLVFVVIGRASHGETLLGVVTTWWPFLAALALAWLVLSAWRHPVRIRWTGLAIWLITVTAGLLLRVASGQGVQPSFVIVTFLVLGLFLVGWRAVAEVASRLGRRVPRAGAGAR
jgi:hypothetical protein